VCSRSQHSIDGRQSKCQKAITFDISDTMLKVTTWAQTPSESGAKRRSWRSTGSIKTCRLGQFLAGQQRTMCRFHWLGGHETKVFQTSSDILWLVCVSQRIYTSRGHGKDYDISYAHDRWWRSRWTSGKAHFTKLG
jgi:hypothetical protein